MTAQQKAPGIGVAGGSMDYVKAGSFDTIEYSQNHLKLKNFPAAGVRFCGSPDDWEPLDAAVIRALQRAEAEALASGGEAS